MNTGGASVEPAPRLARVIVVLASAALASSQLMHVLRRPADGQWPGILAGASCVAVLLLFERTRALADAASASARPAAAPGGLPGRRATARSAARSAAFAQALVCFAVAVPFGVTSGLTCLPAASFLLARRRVAAGGTIALAAVIDVGQSASPRDVVLLVLMASLGSMLLYELARLSSLIASVHVARVALAASAVSAERLRVAEEVRSAIADNLAALRAPALSGDAAAVVEVALRATTEARAASRELRGLSLAPETASARALLASAGIAAEVETGHAEPLGASGTVLATVLREAVTEVVRRGRARTCRITTQVRDGHVVLRVTDDGERTAEPGIAAFTALAARVTAAGGRFGAHLDAEGRFTVEASMPSPAPVVDSGPADPEYREALTMFGIALATFCVQALLYVPPRWYAAAVPALAVVCGLQVRYSMRDARRGGLIGLVVLAVTALLPLNAFGRDWIGAPGFLAGSLLMALPLRFSIPLALAAAGTAGAVVGLPAHSIGLAADDAINALITGVLVYGLLRLIRLVRELHEAARLLASATAVRERLRIARDLHDLLGHRLAAILLKAELAHRLRDRDPARAAAESGEIAALAASALDELHTVLGDTTSLSLRQELDSSVRVLEAAGIVTETDVAPVPMDAEASAALGVVVREAVTNVLRHSAAVHCRIALDADASGVRLVVENDGLRGGVTSPGAGLGNLAIRLAELGGVVHGTAEDGWYVLEARIPGPTGQSGLAGEPVIAGESALSVPAPAPTPATAAAARGLGIP